MFAITTYGIINRCASSRKIDANFKIDIQLKRSSEVSSCHTQTGVFQKDRAEFQFVVTGISGDLTKLN